MGILDYPVQPDFDSFLDVVHRRRRPDRVYQAELFMDEAAKKRLRDALGISQIADDHAARRVVRDDVALYQVLGIELVRVHSQQAEFVMDVRSSADSSTGEFARTGQGYVVHEHGGPIQNDVDIENYPWPTVESIDPAPYDWAEQHMPDGMRGYDLTMQVFEALSWLLGYETLFISMVDNPEFIDRVLERVGTTFLDYTRFLCQYESIGVIWGTDDMGHKTGTLVSPDWLREKILPWHQQAAEIAHAAGKEYFLHSCGNIEAVVPDIIDTVKIDAKHSFEDGAIPVTDFFDRYGERVGIIGGLDIDFLSQSSEEAVRAKTREVLEHCHADGGYVLGTGNSVTDYLPTANYLAMLEEGRRFGEP